MSNSVAASPTTANLADWIGRSETREDRIDPRQVIALAATLDWAAPPERELPPLWHWVYFTPAARQSELGVDGHPRRGAAGGILPPVELPNRMWAGGRLTFHQPLVVGEAVTRVSRLIRAERKSGKAGDLVFVTVHHAISGANGLSVEEEHDIVYRNPAPKGTPPGGEVAPAAAPGQFRQLCKPDSVLLFRYSALTFNGHRIHYDYPYVTQEEGYPGLVVHGPLTATLLLQGFLQAHPGKRVTGFAFRAVGPIYDNQTFDVCGEITGPGQAKLWTDCAGRLTMKADVTFAE